MRRLSKFPLDISKGIITVDVTIDRECTIYMALDTGATSTSVPFEVAKYLGYQPENSKRSIKIYTANGLIYAPIIRVKSLRCLGREVKNIDVVCSNLPSDAPVDGLLGLNFLKHFNLGLHFKRKVLEI